MRLSARSQHVPSFLQLELMLNKLKLRQPNEKGQERQRLNTQTIQPNNQSINLKEYGSIVFDNYQNPNCFEQQIKEIDVKSLNRVLQKKPLINSYSRKADQTEINFSRESKKKSIKSQYNISNNSSELMLKFKDHIEQLNRHSHNKISLSSKFRKIKSTAKINNPNESNCPNKQNKNTMVNENKNKKLESSQIKTIIASKIQLHKFSDCQQLLRDAGKK